MSQSPRGFLHTGNQHPAKVPFFEDAMSSALWRRHWFKFRTKSRKPFPLYFFDDEFKTAQDGHEANIPILLIDGGVVDEHPDLKGKISYLFKPQVQERMAIQDHATAMASIAVADDYGLVPKSPLYSAPIVSSERRVYEANLSLFLELLPDFLKSVNNRCIVAGTMMTEPSPGIEKVVNQCLEAGCPVVWAAGNLGEPIENFSPTRIPEVISVGAANACDSILWETEIKSNFSDRLTLFAPGKNIFTAWTTKSYYTLCSGTSPAAMIVASSLAKQKNYLNSTEAKEHLMKSSTEGLLLKPSGISTSNRLLFDSSVSIKKEIYESLPNYEVR